MKGTGRAVFVAILLLIAGTLNIIYGFGAIGNATHCGPGATGNRDVVEEPTAAELAVLRCLAAGLLRRVIGARLCSR